MLNFLFQKVFAEEEEVTKFTPLSTGLEDLGFDQSSLQDFGAFLTQLYQSVIAIAVVASIVVIIWGGFIYMTTDAIGKKQEGKEKIKNAIFGLLIALSSYLIFNLIDPNMREVNLGENLINTNLAYEAADNHTLGGSAPEDTSTITDNALLGEDGTMNYEDGVWKGRATNFGYNDSEDNGWGSPLLKPGGLQENGINTNNSQIEGVAIPASVLKKEFGITLKKSGNKYSDHAAVRNSAVEISGIDRNGNRTTRIVPIVDYGPSEARVRAGVVVDETYALNQRFGGDGQRSYRIIKNYYNGERN